MFNCSLKIQSLFKRGLSLKLNSLLLTCGVTFIAAFSLASCTKKNVNVERLAILPSNLLVSDPASEWLKAGVPIALQYDLMTAKTLIPGFAPDEAAATQGGATRILRTSIESRQGGLHIEATLLDMSTKKVIRTESADATSASVILPAINTLAKKLDPAAVEFSSKSSDAWQAMAAAENTNVPQQRAQYINQAISKDQNFGFAWVSLLDMVAMNRQTNLSNMLTEAKKHRSAFSPYDGAKFDVVMNRLSNATPADQIKAAQAALAIAPNDLEMITELGNYQILQGDSANGEQAMRRAVALNPANIGLKFELGRALMRLRKFKEADTIFSAIDKNPSIYPELATCVLLEGDKVRATATFDKFIAVFPNEELKPILRSSWLVMSGDRQKGVDLVLSSKFPTQNIQVLALSQATIWQLMGGDYDNAQKTVLALTKASGQAVALPVVANLLADKKSSPADWLSKVNAVGMPDAIKQPVLAYGYFLRGNYDEAAKVWQKVNDEGHGEDLHSRAMFASSLDRAGKKLPTPVNVIPFTPEFTDLYAAISFTEMRRMLAK